MSVKSTQFLELNALRPAKASWGEVTSINLRVTLPDGITYSIGESKRKSVHVPPSSNAYWNWMALRAELTRFYSSNGVERQIRNVLNASLKEAVRCIHKISLEEHYGTQCPMEAVQYFDLTLKIVEIGFGLDHEIVHVVVTEAGTELLVTSYCHEMESLSE